MKTYKVSAWRTCEIIETADLQVEADTPEEAEKLALSDLTEGEGDPYYKMGDQVGTTDWQVDPDDIQVRATE